MTGPQMSAMNVGPLNPGGLKQFAQCVGMERPLLADSVAKVVLQKMSNF